MLFLELNEFNAQLLEKASVDLQLKSIQKMISMNRTKTQTDGTYESDFLEPWVQWVSIHTGKSSTLHQIKHLGDVPHLEMKQLWEILSEKGVTSGIWGAMNASRNEASGCRFFLPDPWTASEQAYPPELNRLLEPLRYVSKNYLNLAHLGPKIKALVGLFISQGLGSALLKETPRLLKNVVRFRGAHFVFISFIEYLSTLLFLKYRELYNPDFSLLFLNSLAHLQHHHWNGEDLLSNKCLSLGFRYLNMSLEAIHRSLKPGEAFVVTNALSQKNTNEEKPWILYRQIDQKAFLRTVGISCARIESLMTHDAHLFFNNEKDAKSAFQLLSEARIYGQPLFVVEPYSEVTKLFYRICFTDQVAEDASFMVGGKFYRFFDLFKPIVQRTGKHIPHGTLYSNQQLFPQTIKNHEIYHYLIDLF